MKKFIADNIVIFVIAALVLGGFALYMERKAKSVRHRIMKAAISQHSNKVLTNYFKVPVQNNIFPF